MRRTRHDIPPKHERRRMMESYIETDVIFRKTSSLESAPHYIISFPFSITMKVTKADVRRRRPIRTTMSCWPPVHGWQLVLMLLVMASWKPKLSFLNGVKAQPQDLEVECAPSQVQYDWERWNYYEILGLKRPLLHSGAVEAAESESSSKNPYSKRKIQQAYRKQAQLWHPDKHSPNRNATLSGRTTTSSSSSMTSQEEATARFARIAQAYEVLSDDWKRKEYDLFLKFCDDRNDNIEETSNSEKTLSRWSRLFSKIDPFSVLEEFWFGSEDEQQNDEYHHRNRAGSHEMPPPPSAEPIRIFEHQDEFRNGREEIVRISQTEEYAPDGSSGTYYYRVISQDFVKRIDPYSGDIALHPLTKPYLREEGHRMEKPSELPRQSFLFPGDVLNPKSALLVSPNRRFYAGLSPDCELMIMADNAFGEDTMVWSSESPFQTTTSGADYHQRHRRERQTYQEEYCFATLRGPHLVVALGPPETPRRILWYSEAEDAGESDDGSSGSHSSSHYDAQSTFLAQLENDGSLVVYKVWTPSRYYKNLPLSARVWIATRNFLEGATRDDQFESLLLGAASAYSPLQVSVAAPTYKRCIYATGPTGCYRLARKLYQLSMEIYFRVKSIMGKMDQMFDTWMDLITEEDNYLEALKQSTSGWPSQIVAKSAKMVRRVLELVMMRGSH